jgi:hypothetical protein
MLSISQNFATDLDFAQFDDELEESGSLPYLQVINPGSKNAKVLDKDPLAYGLAITVDNAEAVGIVPEALGWEMGEDIPIHPLSQAVIERGYVGRSANLVVIAQGELEVQRKTGDRWQFAGLAWDGGKRTAIGQAAADESGEKKEFRLVRRWLVLLLNDSLEPLHDRPLQLTGKGAFGTSLSMEFNDFQLELGQAYRAAAKAQGRTVKGGRFSKSAQAYTVFPFSVGYHIPKDNDRGSYACINARYQPVADPAKVGQASEIDRRDRKVAVTGIHYSQLMINRESTLGKNIAELQAEYADFAKPNRGRDVDAVEDGSRPYSGQGHLDMSAIAFNPDGTVAGVFDDGTARHPVFFAENLAHLATEAELVIDGVIPADGGPVQVTAVREVEVAAATPLGKVPAGLSF